MFTLGRGPRYCAWLLRCWEVPGAGPDAPASWRCSLEDPHTRERRGFASLEALTAFLGAELALGCDAPPGDDEELGTSQARRSSGGGGEGGGSRTRGGRRTPGGGRRKGPGP